MTFPDFQSVRLIGSDAARDTDVAGGTTTKFAVRPPKGAYGRFFKRALDVTAVALALPAVVPVIAVAAVMVARDGGKPFYTQMRVGRGGRVFRMWKLRTMVADADERMEDYLSSHPEARLEWDRTQKLKADPRITKFGRFLRKSSLDELPQLWNVLRGDMSLVGPRPMLINQQQMYPGTDYYALRPGITGYWQTAGRNRTTFEARAEYDSAYAEELSFANDIRVLAATVGVVVNATGY